MSEHGRAVYDRIERLCNERGITPWKLAQELGFSQAYFTAAKTTGSVPTSARLQKIADYFNVPTYELLGEPKRKPTVINILGRVAAGVPIEAVEHIIGTEEITDKMAATGEHFGLRIKGDSMSPEIKDGDIVIVRKQSDADSGDIVIALVDGQDACCKELRKYDDMIMLVSLNPAYAPITSNDDPITIIGKVVENRRAY